jgi:hypothetical protein
MSALKSRLKNSKLPTTTQSREKSKNGVRKVVFEGGLGSQLIPFLEKSYLASLKIPFLVDANYFNLNEKISKTRGRADHWSYRLDFYGITLDSLMDGSVPNSSEMEASQDRNFDLWDSNFWNYVRRFGADLLPINSDLLQDFKYSLGIGANEDYSVIHVRRGDYLRVASHIVTDSMWLGVVERIKPLTSTNLVITSDSEIPQETKNEVHRIFKESSIRVIYLEGNTTDECILHDFMRSSNVLVASNSTYSFSAAALSMPNTFCVIPSVFYGDKELEELNQGIRAAGDFFILKK